MTRLLSELFMLYNINISGFNGGNLRNAIPRESFATITVEKSSINLIKDYIPRFQETIFKELGSLEPNLKLDIKEVLLPENIMSIESQKNLLSALTAIPHGAIAWSEKIDDLVETSTNLASVKFENNNTIIIVSTQRSSVESSKDKIALQVETCLTNIGATVTHSEGYPGWNPDLSSEILQITRNAYKKLFGKDPLVKAIHAGLECGLIYEKFTGIDMISFGPTIKGAHTPEEKINIQTTQMFWDLLIEVINSII